MEGIEVREVCAREILDSRGNPTVEAEVHLRGGIVGSGIAPSGASTGSFEALELRDQEKRYQGKGVQKAVGHVNTEIRELLVQEKITDNRQVDEAMRKLDGTKDKSKLGANAILAVSIAAADACAKARKLPLYRYLGGVQGKSLPVPMMNIINGGAHVAAVRLPDGKTAGLDTQEFMIMPIGAKNFQEALRMCSEVYHTLGALLKKDGHSTAVGDEGGFAPSLDSDEAAIEYILQAIRQAGYQAGKEADFVIAMDAAASEWKQKDASEMLKSEQKITGQSLYHLPKSGKTYSTDELIAHWKDLAEKYPIASIEDPLDEEDWEGWKKLTMQLGDKVQLVGDDLFVTNTERLAKGIREGCGNSILIKMNQIGTVSETIAAIRMAQQAGYTAIISHRSGETEDTTIADLAVAVNAGQIKTGAPCRSERVAKYNRLLRIEEELSQAAEYPGRDAFGIRKRHTEKG